jgi:hypothetical protein
LHLRCYTAMSILQCYLLYNSEGAKKCSQSRPCLPPRNLVTDKIAYIPFHFPKHMA